MTDFEHMLREVFSGPVRTLSVQEICLHFMEEVGEVSQALADATVSEAASRRRTRVARFAAERTEKTLAMAEELADVFSWAGSLLAKVKLELVSFEEYFKGRADPGQVQRIRRILAGARELNFADMIWQKYGLRFGELRCSVCGGRPCSCSDQNQRPLQGESLSRFKDRIRAALQGFG
jgi:NTP pyrophosphatase (non-canonical NTP hydrolase)